MILNLRHQSAICYIDYRLMTALWSNLLEMADRLPLEHLDLDQHQAAISFINVNGNHWVLVYMDAIQVNVRMKLIALLLQKFSN